MCFGKVSFKKSDRYVWNYLKRPKSSDNSVIFIFIFLPHSYLEEVRRAGENAAEFFQLYQRLIQPTYWKFYLALQGALMQIGQLLTKVHCLKFVVRTDARNP